MDFGFSEEEELFRNAVRDFCQKRLAPLWVEMDQKGIMPVDLVRDMARQGMVGTIISPDYGGPGGSPVLACIAVEEAAYADPSVATAVYLLVQNSWPYMLEKYGTEEAKQEILPLVTSGEWLLSIASTEAQGGSDVSGFRTMKARRKDEKTWVLNGDKELISFMPMIDRMKGGGYFLITRSGALEDRHNGITNFVFLSKKDGKASPGYKYSVYKEIGRHGVQTGNITLADVEIDDKYRVGDVNRGFTVAMEGFNLARCLIGVASVGAARWMLDQGREFITQRKLWGKPLSAFQGISFKFAELYSQVEAARLLSYRAAWLADRYYFKKDPNIKLKDVAVAAACAKMTAPETAEMVGREIMKMMGGIAFFEEMPIHRAWLGSSSYTFGAEGPQNIMKYIIARNVIGSEFT